MGVLLNFRHLPSRRLTILTFILGGVSLIILTAQNESRSALLGLSSLFPSFEQYYGEYIGDTLSPPHAGVSTIRDGSGKVPLEKHPILELIQRAKRKAVEMEEKRNRIQSLEDAVRDYQEAFGMDPPEGFDQWYDLSQSLNATTAPSLVPLAHESVLPFLALPADVLRKRVRGLFGLQAMCGLEFNSQGETAEDKVQMIYGDNQHIKSRPTPFDWLSLLRIDHTRIPPAQNASEPVQLAMWVDDAAFRMTDGDLVERAKGLARAGKIWDMDDLGLLEKEAESAYSWAATCPSPIRPNISALPETPSSPPKEKRFITDMKESTSYCEHPELLGLNGELFMRNELPMRGFVPALVITRPLHGADMVGPPTERVNEFVKEPKSWDQKTDSRLLFRGQATGVYHIDRYPWRMGQRDRLSFLGHPTEDKWLDVLVDHTAGAGKVKREKWSVRTLAKKYLNVGLVKQNEVWNCAVSGPQRFACGVDPLIWLPNCPGSGKACEEMLEEHHWEPRISREDSQLFKYIPRPGWLWMEFQVEEGAINGQYDHQDDYNEWWTEQSIPWYHYVPGLYDYSDIFDILAFFAGSPDGSSPGRDDLAREIAMQGREFAKDHLRWEDIRSYLLLIVLEYRRAWSDDRQAASFRL